METKKISEILSFFVKNHAYATFSSLCRIAQLDVSNAHNSLSGKRTLSLEGSRAIAEAIGFEVVVHTDDNTLHPLPNIVLPLRLESSQIQQLVGYMKDLRLPHGRWTVVHDEAANDAHAQVALIARCPNSHIAVQIKGPVTTTQLSLLEAALPATRLDRFTPSTLRWVRVFNPATTHHQLDQLFSDVLHSHAA